MKSIDAAERKRMMDMAFGAMERAYAPYSNFLVGACLKASSGRYYLGCNIENAAFTPTSCAERTALVQAVYEGERAFDGIVIVCSGKNPAYPCGVCRQALNEFCGSDMPIICANGEGACVELTLGDLLPYSFGPGDLA